MKILFPFIGDSVGGSHISTVDYIIELNKKKIETKVLIFKKNSYLEKYLILKKIKFEVLSLPIINLDNNIFKNFFSLILGLKNARKYLKINRISIVHTNDIRNHYSWSIWSLFVSDHIWHQRTMWPISLQFYFFIFLTKKIFCNSDYLKDKINFKFIKKKCYLVSNIFYPFKKKKFNKNAMLIVGFFSNIQTIKRPDVIVNFLKQITQKKENIKIHCYGTDRKKILNKYSEKLIFRKYFQYFGHKINILPHMKKCDFIVATSENDTFGRTILEGMSLGIPILATNLGGHKYLIKNNINGYLFNPKNNELLKKIKLVNRNKQYNKKVILNAQRFIENYNKQEVINKLISAYET